MPQNGPSLVFQPRILLYDGAYASDLRKTTWNVYSGDEVEFWKPAGYIVTIAAGELEGVQNDHRYNTWETTLTTALQGGKPYTIVATCEFHYSYAYCGWYCAYFDDPWWTYVVCCYDERPDYYGPQAYNLVLTTAAA